MNRRGAGVNFCFIAALLYLSRYITAAIYFSNITGWSQDTFAIGLTYVGDSLTILSAISLAAGIVYLLSAERVLDKLMEYMKKPRMDMKDMDW